MLTATPQQDDWATLGQSLQQLLRQQWLKTQLLQVRCAVREGRLLVLAEHLLHVEPDPEEIFTSLEATICDLLPGAILTEEQNSGLKLPHEIPVQLLLRISGYQQPYASKVFLYISKFSPSNVGDLPSVESISTSLSQDSSVQPAVSPSEATSSTSTLPSEALPSSEAQLSHVQLPRVTPEIAAPEVATPEVTTPEVVEPEPSASEILEPEVVAPEITEPEITQPEITELAELAEPDPPIEVFATPEVATLENIESKIAEPEIAELRITELGISPITESETVTLEIAEPEITESEIVEPELVALETLEPEVTEPEVVTSEIAESQILEPKTTTLEITESEIVEPELAVEPEPVELEILEITEPEIAEPETLESITSTPTLQILSIESASSIPRDATETIDTGTVSVEDEDTDRGESEDISESRPVDDFENTSFAEPIELAAVEPLEDNRFQDKETENEITSDNAVFIVNDFQETTEETPSNYEFETASIASEIVAEIEPELIEPEAIETATVETDPLPQTTHSLVDVSANTPANCSEIQQSEIQQLEDHYPEPELEPDSLQLDSIEPFNQQVDHFETESMYEDEQPNQRLVDTFHQHHVQEADQLDEQLEGEYQETNTKNDLDSQKPQKIETNNSTNQVEQANGLDDTHVENVATLNPTAHRPFRWTASSLGLAGAVGGFVLVSGLYVLTRPCVIGACEPLQQAKQLSQEAIQTAQTTDSALAVVDAYKQLNEASYLLATIPSWSRHYGAAQSLLSSYEDQAAVLGKVVNALEQANTAAQKSQNPPHPLPEWREIQLLWREVIAQLEQIPPDSTLYPLVQRKLAEYRDNLSKINQRVGIEQQAQERINAARQAGQLAESRAGAAQTAANWQETAATWATAIAQLRQVPQNTMVYDEAQQLLEIYQPNLNQAKTQQTQELLAEKAYTQALSAATQARASEQQNQWTQATNHWKTALTHAQQVPSNSSYYSQIQPLVSTYTQMLQQATQNSQRSAAIQTIKPSLNQACPQAGKVCTYTLSPQAIRVQFTLTYDQTVSLTLQNKQPTDSSSSSFILDQVNKSLRILADVSKATQVPVELYDAKGTKLGTYTPSLSGYVPQ